MKILIVEDDAVIAQTLEFLLGGCNYAVDIATDGEMGKQMADAFDYDLAILDILLPKLDGLSLCRELRAQQLTLPILLLTGQGGGHQKALALNAGADDYVTKPFDAEELVARVQALLRRCNGDSKPMLEWGNLRLEPCSQTVTYGTHILTLTPKEYAILELLLRNPQQVFSAQAILDHAWSSIESPGEETVRFHIKALRKKLKDVGAPVELIKTVYGVGYRLNPIYKTVDAGNTPESLEFQIAELTALNQELREVLDATQRDRDQLVQRLTIVTQDFQQIQRQWQAVFEHGLSAIAIVDDAGYPKVLNRVARRLWGATGEEMPESSLTHLFSPADTIQKAWDTLPEAGVIRGKFTLTRDNGESCTIKLVAIAYAAPQGHLVLMYKKPAQSPARYPRLGLRFGALN